METILVTGAAGFIGFHAACALLAKGYHVIGIDNFNAYYTPHLKQARACELKRQGIDVLEMDVNDRERLKQLFTQYSFTRVLHLAAQAGVRYAREHPDVYLRANIDGFLSILETLRLFPHIPLIYASSSSVYGLNTKIPFSTADQTDHPANLYAVTKKTNELMAYSYHHLYGIRSVGLRFFTVYGPWGRPDMAYYLFTEALLANQPIRLFNGGNMQRDFTYIDDIVTGILAALEYPIPYALFNFGNHQPLPLLTLVHSLERILGKRAELILEGPSAGEVPLTYADITESQRELGFAPKVSLEEGLSHFVEWYKKYRVDSI